MHDLKPLTALGGDAPQVDVIGTLTIAENDTLALASVAARAGHSGPSAQHLETLLGAVPAVGKAVLHDPLSGFWMGPEQWMIGAPLETHEDLAGHLKERLGAAASITEQTGAWVVFDVTGARMPDLCEILCNVPIRRMQTGDVQRTMIHQLGCFVIRGQEGDHIRILGPRASAGSLHHSLTTAARAVA